MLLERWSRLVGWLDGWILLHINLCRLFNAKSFIYENSQLYFKQFSLAWVHSLIVKTVLIQLIQFSVSTDFVNTLLNFKTVLY